VCRRHDQQITRLEVSLSYSSGDTAVRLYTRESEQGQAHRWPPCSAHGGRVAPVFSIVVGVRVDETTAISQACPWPPLGPERLSWLLDRQRQS